MSDSYQVVSDERDREISSLRKQVHDLSNEIQALRLAMAIHNRTVRDEKMVNRLTEALS